jgi:hypothetical protein
MQDTAEHIDASQLSGSNRDVDDEIAQLHTRSHRETALSALADAQRNPVLSVDQLFAVAEINILLPIDERLADLVLVAGAPR